MASRICWKCGVHSHQTLLERAWGVVPVFDSWMAAFRCDECSVLSLGRHRSAAHAISAANVPTEMSKAAAPIDWYPIRALEKDFPYVPEHIAAAASEATACHSIDSLRAAVLLARSVIEATAKERGITTGTLVHKIDEMHNQHLIRELVREQAHEIRHLGNDMAHGDFVDPVTEEESAEILELMSEVLNEVYQAPAKLAARRHARIQKQAETST